MSRLRVRRRPEKSEYFDYYDMYVKLVPEGDIVSILGEQRDRSLDFLRSIPEEKAEYRYEPGKWSVKEVVGHVVDIEWVFTYRALSFARGESSPLPGVDQDELMTRADFSVIPMPDLIGQFQHLRTANTLLFAGMDEAVLDRRGTASGYSFTVRSIPYIIAGHETHHMAVLEERYLGA